MNRALVRFGRSDVEFGGPYRIIEQVTVLDVPARRLVVLCWQKNGRIVRAAWSDATTGNVDFKNVAAGPWVLYAVDSTGQYEAVAISDRIATVGGGR